MGPKTGVKHLEEGIKDELVKKQTDTNQMIVQNMLIYCHKILPSFGDIVHSFLPRCCVLKEYKGNHVQANSYRCEQFLFHMELFVTFIRKFNLVADSAFDTVSVIILRIKIPEKQVVTGENTDNKKNNLVEEPPFISD